MNALTPNRVVTRRERAKRKEENKITCQEEERIHFPKKQSRVGQKYQATNLPVAGTHELDTDSESAACYDQVWDPAEAERAKKLDFVHRCVVHNKKENGMVLFHERRYEVSGLFEDLAKTSPLDGSNWSREERMSFHKLVFSYRKDIGRVAKSMGKSLNNCLAYYYGRYKMSADYVDLKRMMTRLASSKLQNVNLCACCNESDDLLHCAGCKKYYHAKCINISPVPVTQHKWHCDLCQGKKKKSNSRKRRKSSANPERNEKKQSKPTFHVERRFSRRLQTPLELCLMA